MRSLPEIKAVNAAMVDRNVTVHLRARQADIYEKALRKILRECAIFRTGITGRDAIRIIATKAIKRAERIR